MTIFFTFQTMNNTHKFAEHNGTFGANDLFQNLYTAFVSFLSSLLFNENSDSVGPNVFIICIWLACVICIFQFITFIGKKLGSNQEIYDLPRDLIDSENSNDSEELTDDEQNLESALKYHDITIIGVTGLKRSGKDTIGAYLVNNYSFVRVAYADALKEACKIIFGFSDEQVYGDVLKEVIDTYWNHTPREILQKVGTELFRMELPRICKNITNDIWIRSVERQILSLIEKGHTRFVITDCRFANEMDYILKSGGTTWRVTRDSLQNSDVHESEIHITKFNVEYEFFNDGTLDDLYDEVDILIRQMNL